LLDPCTYLPRPPYRDLICPLHPYSFGGSGAVTNVLGFIIGGVLLLPSWRAIWYFTGALVLPLSLPAAFLIPETPIAVESYKEEAAAKMLPKVDNFGFFFQTAAIVLLVFGLTQANVIGW
jgi:MFS family permease